MRKWEKQKKGKLKWRYRTESLAYFLLSIAEDTPFVHIICIFSKVTAFKRGQSIQR